MVEQAGTKTGIGCTAGQVTQNGMVLQYQIFSPTLSEGRQYPLVLYLHDTCESGRVEEAAGFAAFTAPGWQAQHPCFVCAPLCPQGGNWAQDALYRLLVHLAAVLPGAYPIDATRLYLTGAAAGACGCWNLLAKSPDPFAAVMPVGGAGRPGEVLCAQNMPVWAFHAADDPCWPVSALPLGDVREGLYGNRRMVSALRGTGNRQVRYTEYPAGTLPPQAGSDRAAAYGQGAALEWMFGHTLKQRYRVDNLMPGVWQICDYFRAY